MSASKWSSASRRRPSSKPAHAMTGVPVGGEDHPHSHLIGRIIIDKQYTHTTLVSAREVFHEQHGRAAEQRPHSRQVTRSCWAGSAINNSPHSRSLPLSQYGSSGLVGWHAPDRHDSEGSKRHASTIDWRGGCLTAHMQPRATSHKALPALKLHRGCNVCPARALYDVR